MKVEQIRQDSHVDEYLKLHVADVQEILRHKEEFVDVSCPACGGDENAWRFDKSSFRFVECLVCETLFINPRPNAKLLAEFYTSARSFALFNSKIFPASEDARRRLIFAPRAEKIVELCKTYLAGPPDVLLDIGAGFGTFCQEIQKLKVFKQVIALEPSKGLAETCRKKGLTVIENTVEEMQVETARVVVCFELIEHLFSPRDLVTACAHVMSDDGLLILTTPNIKGFDLKVLGPLSENVDGPEHLNYFHKESLGLLLQRCGLEVLQSLTPGRLDAELVRKKAMTGELDLSLQPFLKQVLLADWEQVGPAFQDFLVDQGLSSHMWMVACKNVS